MRVRKVQTVRGTPFREIPDDDRTMPECLYIVRPDYLDKYEPTTDPQHMTQVGQTKYNVHTCFRCGSVGTKAYQYKVGEGNWKSRPSSLYGRMMMYESNWFTGGRVYAVLKLDAQQSVRKGMVRAMKNEEGQGFVKFIENQFHERLTADKEIRRIARTETEDGQKHASEWFEGDLQKMIKHLSELSINEDNKSIGKLYLYGDRMRFRGRARYVSKEYIVRSKTFKGDKSRTDGMESVGRRSQSRVNYREN